MNRHAHSAVYSLYPHLADTAGATQIRASAMPSYTADVECRAVAGNWHYGCGWWWSWSWSWWHISGADAMMVCLKALYVMWNDVCWPVLTYICIYIYVWQSVSLLFCRFQLLLLHKKIKSSVLWHLFGVFDLIYYIRAHTFIIHMRFCISKFINVLI